ncbi:MAG: peptidase C69, partial [Paraprevotella sp.]|nr:peptidase C69 [Paraprevotella sp.]
LTEYTHRTASGMLYAWIELGKRLMVKYLDGGVRPEQNGEYVRTAGGVGVPVQRPGYPERYRREIVKATGDRFEVK